MTVTVTNCVSFFCGCYDLVWQGLHFKDEDCGRFQMLAICRRWSQPLGGGVLAAANDGSEDEWMGK